MKVPRSTKGTLVVKTTKTKSDGTVFDELFEEDFKNKRSSKPIAMIRHVIGFGISKSYCSVKVDIGIEMPWPVRAGNLTDVNEGMTEVEAVIYRKLRIQKRVAEKALKELIKSSK